MASRPPTALPRAPATTRCAPKRSPEFRRYGRIDARISPDYKARPWRRFRRRLLLLRISRQLPANRGTEPMANTSSAKKATRKIARRTVINKARRSRMRSYVRGVEEAITAGDKAIAIAALRAAEPEIMRAAQKGVV